MKPAFLGLCFLLTPLAVQASIGGGPPPDFVSPAPTGQPAGQSGDLVQQAAPGETAAVSQRRSTMIRESTDRPVLKLSAMYHVVDQDRSDNCLAGTGTHIKRAADGISRCVIGNGRVFMPER
jgi:hypothetical protein